jgi:hypothetical protein
MGRKSLGLFDIISLIFVILTVGWLLFVLVRLLGPAPVETETVVVPTEYLAPTFTPSRTPSATLPPTFTPTPTLTQIPSLTPTPSPTITTTPTITETLVASLTPSITDTVVASPTFTPTGPTQPPSATPSPYLYDLRGGTYQLVPNTFNAAGCAWRGSAAGFRPERVELTISPAFGYTCSAR